MESTVIAFLVGVVVGVAAVLAIAGLRRVRADSETTLRQGVLGPAATGPTPTDAPATVAEPFPGARIRTSVTTHVTRSQIRFDGAAPTVTVDGRTYDSLADLPEPTRNLIVDELRVALPKVPEAARPRLEALIASADGPDASHSPDAGA